MKAAGLALLLSWGFCIRSSVNCKLIEATILQLSRRLPHSIFFPPDKPADMKPAAPSPCPASLWDVSMKADNRLAALCLLALAALLAGLTFERYWDLPVEARTERSSIGRMPVGSI